MRRILLFALLLPAGCSGPDESSVRREFERTRPNAEVVSLGPGEGDSDHVYYHIRYRLPSDSAVQEEEWGYRKARDGRWTRFFIDSTGVNR
jgi:hypothetical protein